MYKMHNKYSYQILMRLPILFIALVLRIVEHVRKKKKLALEKKLQDGYRAY